MGCGASTPAVNDGEAPLQVPPEPPKSRASGPPKRRASYQSPEVTLPDVAGPGNVNPLPSHVVGTYSNHGIKPGPYGKPSAKINQDRGFITYPLCGDKTMCLMAVYDGHGSNGELVSEFVMVKVPDLLEENPERLRTDPVSSLTDAFEKSDKALLDSNIPSSVSGSTGIAVLMHGSKYYAANVGDSRAVLARKAADGTYKTVDLSIDQKPDTPAEQQRILASGGYVSPESPQFGPARVWLRPGEGPGLAMARSLGDHVCKQVGVIATPEVRVFDKTDEDALLVLASDGVWEFITSEEAIEIVSAHEGAQQGCIALINESTKRWRKEEGNYRDDITAIVVHLPLDLQSLDGEASVDGAAATTSAALVAESERLSNEALNAKEDDKDEAGSFQKRRLSVALDVSESDQADLAALAASTEE